MYIEFDLLLIFNLGVGTVHSPNNEQIGKQSFVRYCGVFVIAGLSSRRLNLQSSVKIIAFYGICSYIQQFLTSFISCNGDI